MLSKAKKQTIYAIKTQYLIYLREILMQKNNSNSEEGNEKNKSYTNYKSLVYRIYIDNDDVRKAYPFSLTGNAIDNKGKEHLNIDYPNELNKCALKTSKNGEIKKIKKHLKSKLNNDVNKLIKIMPVNIEINNEQIKQPSSDIEDISKKENKLLSVIIDSSNNALNNIAGNMAKMSSISIEKTISQININIAKDNDFKDKNLEDKKDSNGKDNELENIHLIRV